MTAENEPHRRDEASSTRAQTIAKACQYQTGPQRDFAEVSENSHKDVYVAGGVVKPNDAPQPHRGHSRFADKAWCFLNFSLRRPLLVAGAGTEEILDLGEESGGFGLGRARGQLLEFGQQFLLLLG